MSETKKGGEEDTTYCSGLLGPPTTAQPNGLLPPHTLNLSPSSSIMHARRRKHGIVGARLRKGLV